MALQEGVRRTALVTGAGKGIGLEFSRLLAADGHDLLLVGRDRRPLDRLAAELRAAHNIAVRGLACDLAVPGAAASLWSELSATGASVDILVNNAGVGLYGRLAEQTPEDIDRMVQLNVAALTALIR